jgi:hypothetical protein
MTTPTGTIGMSDVMTELGISGVTALNDTDVRALAEKASGIISMDDLRGKSTSTMYTVYPSLIWSFMDTLFNGYSIPNAMIGGVPSTTIGSLSSYIFNGQGSWWKTA